MNEEFIEAIDNNLIVEGEPIADEIATDLLVDESSLTPTDATEAFIETFDSSDSTAAEQEQAVEEIVEAIVEEPLDIPIPDDVLETLIAFINDLTVAGTPASDAFQVGSTGTDLILGREGNDVILAVNPQLDLPGLGETDIFSGGSESDRFILGDRRKAYYDDGDDSTTGDNDVAIIVDFNPNEDVIQLHGSPEDYTLVDFAELGEGETGTAIFLRGETNDELIGSLNNVGGLNLDADYFQFKNGSPEEPVLSLIKQFGTAGIDLSFTIANSKDRSNSVLVAGYTSGNLGRRNRGAMDGFFY